MKKIIILSLGIILLSFLVGIYFYPQMPSQIASHWDINGKVNGYMSKFWGLFLMPLISLFLFFIFSNFCFLGTAHIIINIISRFFSDLKRIRKFNLDVLALLIHSYKIDPSLGFDDVQVKLFYMKIEIIEHGHEFIRGF